MINRQPKQRGYSPPQPQIPAVSRPPFQAHVYNWKTLTALMAGNVVSFILIGASSSTTDTSTTTTTASSSADGVASSIGVLLFLGLTIVVMVIDWRGFTTLNDHIHWDRMTGGQRFWMGCLYVFFFEIMLAIYLIMACRVHWLARQTAPLQPKQRIATLDARLGILSPVEGACRVCHKPLQVGANYCSYCSAPLVEQPRICPVCATVALPDADYCSNCRASLPDSQ